MSTVRAELALAVENRRSCRRRRRARGRGDGAGARHRRAARPLDRRALGRGAAARRAGRRARRAPEAGAARRADLAARPGRRGRADLAAAPTQPGVRHGRPVDRASPRALPGGCRPRRRAGRRADRLRPRPARLPRMGRRAQPALQTPGRPAARPARAHAAARGRQAGAGDPTPRGACSSRSGAPARAAEASPAVARRHGGVRSRRRAGAAAALELRGVWHELRDGPAILRGVDLAVEPGEAVVLMGRNGAGKSTLLRHAAGLLEPTRGRVRAGGRVASAAAEPRRLLPARAGRRRGARGGARSGRAYRRCPSATHATSPAASASAWRSRSSSGGDRPAAVLALDEPTRGMDRAAKARLARMAAASGRRRGWRVLVATHDVEFAAEFATRAVLLADGRVIADGPDRGAARGRLVFRHRDGSHPRRRRRRPAARRGRRAASPPRRAGRGRPTDRRGAPMSWQLASFAHRPRRPRAGVLVV